MQGDTDQHEHEGGCHEEGDCRPLGSAQRAVDALLSDRGAIGHWADSLGLERGRGAGGERAADPPLVGQRLENAVAECSAGQRVDVGQQRRRAWLRGHIGADAAHLCGHRRQTERELHAVSDLESQLAGQPGGDDDGHDVDGAERERGEGAGGPGQLRQEGGAVERQPHAVGHGGGSDAVERGRDLVGGTRARRGPAAAGRQGRVAQRHVDGERGLALLVVVAGVSGG